MRHSVVGLCTLFAIGLSVLACGISLDAGGAAAATNSGTVGIKDGSGETQFKVKPKDGGAKVVDGSNNELFRLSLKDATKVKIKGPDDSVLAYVKGGAEKLKVKDAEQESTDFSLKRQADGDYKLLDAADRLILKLKRRDYGWVARDRSELDVFKVKVKDGKTSLRTASDVTLYYTKDPVNALAFACLGFDDLDWAQRFGLYFQLSEAMP